MMDEIKGTLETQMGKAIDSLKYQMTKVRTGRASASVLDKISVDYYRSATPLNQVGQVSTPEARLLQIQPFDKTIIADIEKAILSANIGLTPSNDGNLIHIPFPAITDNRRKEQVREVKKLGENTKIAIRNSHHNQNNIVKKAEKDKEISKNDSKKFQSEIQTVTDSYVKKVNEITETKEKEILTI